MKSSKIGILTLFLAVSICTPTVIGQITSSAPPPGTPSPKVEAKPAVEPLPTNNPDELMKAAFDLYKQKKFDEVLANATKAATLAPSDWRPPYIMGLTYWAQRKLKTASDHLAKSLALKPIKEVYLQKANVDRFRNANDEVVADCLAALKLDPNFAPALVMMGEVLRFDEKRREEGLVALRSAIKLDPNQLVAYEYISDILMQAKDEKAAEEILRKAMEVDPKHMAGRFKLGRMLVEQGRLKEARELWETRTSSDDSTFPNFIVALERAENLKKAEDVLAQKPNDPNTLVQMGLAVMDGDSWVVDGRQEKAIAHFRKALAIDPKMTKAQYSICQAYVQIADTDKSKNKDVDRELAKLRKMDTKLADEIVEYRKNYSGGIKGFTIEGDQ